MKKTVTRLLALCCAATLLLTFFACGNTENDLTPTDAFDEKIVGIDEFAVTKTLQDDAGKSVFDVDLVFPQFSETDFTCAQIINSVYAVRAQELQDFASNNVLNASNFLKDNEDAQPWVCRARYTVTYRDSKYICVLCEYSYGMGSESRSKRLESDCFLLETGEQCAIEDFVLNGANIDDLYGLIADTAISKATDEYGRSKLMENMTREKLIEIKKNSPADFYLTDAGITFYYQLSSIAPFKEGVLEYSFTPAEVVSYLSLPTSEQ